jgi:hypothetical protein
MCKVSGIVPGSYVTFETFQMLNRKTLLARHDFKIDLMLFLKSDFVFVIQADPESQSPVVHDDGVAYMFIQHNNVFLLTAARQNCNAASILLFLHRVVDVSAL